MDQKFDIQAYLTRGVERVVADALNSALFTALRSGDLLADEHKGGCVLYEKRDQVQALLK